MKFREYRLKNNLSQRQLSELINVPTTTLYSYESGVCDPSISTLIKMADVYHISVDELIGRQTNLLSKLILSQRERSIIDKILAMNEKQQELTELYIDTMMDHIGG